MTAQSFRCYLKQDLFQAFQVVMASGETYNVLRPEIVLLTRKDVVIGINEIDNVPDNFKICPLLQVAEIKPLNNAND